MRLTFRRPRRSCPVPKWLEIIYDIRFPAKQRWRNDHYRCRNYAYFIDFMPFFGQQMSYHRRRCPARGWIVTRTSYHAGFWCLSLLKRSTKSRRSMASDGSLPSKITLFRPSAYNPVRLSYGLKSIFLGIRTHAAYFQGRLTIRRIR